MGIHTSELVPNRVSVIIAAFNAACTIGEALDSVLAQTHTDIEIIVCDDASSDNTAEIVRSYSDLRIVLLRNTKNLGPGASRNRAIRRASGQWIALLDADDAMHTDRIHRLVSTANDNEVLVFDNLVECHHATDGLLPWKTVRRKREFNIEADKWGEISIESWLKQPRLVMQPLIPVSIIKAHNLTYSNRRNGEDIEFYLSILSAGIRLRYLSSALYYYRITPKSLSSNRYRWETAWQIYANAIPQFSNQKNVVEILEHRMAEAKHLKIYHCFLTLLRERKYIQASAMVVQNPKIIATASIRVARDWRYKKSRRKYSARSRQGSY